MGPYLLSQLRRALRGPLNGRESSVAQLIAELRALTNSAPPEAEITPGRMYILVDCWACRIDVDM